jgi:hypothetical protein
LLQLQEILVWVDGLLETLNPKAKNPVLRRPGWKPGINGIIFPDSRRRNIKILKYKT